MTRLQLVTPTDFQLQMLESTQNIDNLIITAPPTSGKTTALLLHSLLKYSNEEEGIMVILCHSK